MFSGLLEASVSRVFKLGLLALICAEGVVSNSLRGRLEASPPFIDSTAGFGRCALAFSIFVVGGQLSALYNSNVFGFLLFHFWRNHISACVRPRVGLRAGPCTIKHKERIIK